MRAQAVLGVAGARSGALFYASHGFVNAMNDGSRLVAPVLQASMARSARKSLVFSLSLSCFLCPACYRREVEVTGIGRSLGRFLLLRLEAIKSEARDYV